MVPGAAHSVQLKALLVIAERTSRRRSLGIREKYDPLPTLVYELLQSRLHAILRFNLAPETFYSDDIAYSDLRGNSDGAIGFRGRG